MHAYVDWGLIALIIALGAGLVILPFVVSIPKKSAQEARAKKNAEAKEQLAQKEAELKDLEKRYHS